MGKLGKPKKKRGQTPWRYRLEKHSIIATRRKNSGGAKCSRTRGGVRERFGTEWGYCARSLHRARSARSKGKKQSRSQPLHGKSVTDANLGKGIY